MTDDVTDDVTDPTGLHRDAAVDGYDELTAPDGDLRDHWRYVIGSLRMMGRNELAERQADVSDLLRRDGSGHRRTQLRSQAGTGTSAVGPGADGSVDVVPVLVSSDDWSEIETGLVQRAELLDLMLEDLHGAQELVHRGIVPVEVVRRHPGYLPAVLGPPAGHVPGDGRHRLSHYSADLARNRHGSFEVVADHARTPAGLGAVLERRLALSRALPSLFRDAHVHRLAHFFRGLRRALEGLVPPERDEARIVILTPGSHAPDYFEHSYLAGYLGYPLVEPSDLTVRRGRVWLRSLAGLQQVDVVLRWVDDETCDPLELRGAGPGVPGLVEATRRGTVVLANPLGAASVENPGLVPFLPDAAEVLLGVAPTMASIASRWCGRPDHLSEVLDAFADDHQLVLVPLDTHSPRPLRPASMSARARDELAAELRSDPGRWVGQTLPAGGWVPTLVGEQIEPRPCLIRAHLVSRDDSYVALPGGTGRVPAPGAPLLTPHPGEAPSTTITKDVWVLASEPERAGTSLLADNAPAASSSAPLILPSPPTIAGSLPSRTAENLYWFGRHAERAEGTIRWARAVATRITDVDHSEQPSAVWVADLVSAVRVATGRRPSGLDGKGRDDSDGPTGDPHRDLLMLVGDPEDRDGVVAVLGRMGDAALTARELLAGDTWGVIDDIDDATARLRRRPPRSLAAALPDQARILTALSALAGLAAESTVRDPVWLFLDAGRRIERARVLAATSAAVLVPVHDADAQALVQETSLIANDSLITYRRRYRSRLRTRSVIELLLGDPSNPRSLVYQVDRLAEHAANLPAGDDTGSTPEVVERVAELASLLTDADLDRLAHRVVDGHRVELDDLLRHTGRGLTAVGGALGRHFLHVEAPRAMGAMTATGAVGGGGR